MKPNQNFVITLLGYQSKSHTNYWPWAMFYDAFLYNGYNTQWLTLGDLYGTRIYDPNIRRIFITWNDPTAEELYEQGRVGDNDIVIQKLTSLGKKDSGINWTEDAMSFFKTWNWTPYQDVERLYDQGHNIYAFGCRTDTEPFPEKHRICTKLKDRIFWIPFGTCLYNYSELQNQIPRIGPFEYDIGYVGMKWGSVGRGNIDSFADYMDPLFNSGFYNVAIAGKGNPLGLVDIDTHKFILQNSKLCPIVHAPSWRVERGIQDRFWSVFASGRFGVCDNSGIYEFFDEKEVICSEDPEEWVDKSLYYMKNIDAQIPYICNIQDRIKEKYNYHVTWNNILKQVIKENDV